MVSPDILCNARCPHMRPPFPSQSPDRSFTHIFISTLPLHTLTNRPISTHTCTHVPAHSLTIAPLIHVTQSQFK